MSARAGAPRARLTGRAILLATLVGVLLAAAVVPLRDYFEQRSEIRALERQVAELVEQREALEGRIGRYEDPGYLEFLARKCLGMVKVGEIAYVTVPRGGEPRPPSC